MRYRVEVVVDTDLDKKEAERRLYAAITNTGKPYRSFNIYQIRIEDYPKRKESLHES